MNASARTDGSPASSFTAALGEQLVVAHGRLRRRRRRRRTSLAVAVVAIVAFFATASFSIFDPQPAAAEPVKVERQADGSVLITIDRNGALPSDLSAALLAANISNDTVESTTGPSGVGTILSVAFEGGVSSKDLLEKDGRKLVVPAGYTGTIGITFGVPTARGASYQSPSDAFAPKEPLAAFSTSSDPAAVVKAALKKKLQVTIIGTDGAPHAMAAGEKVAPGAILLSGSMRSATQVWLRIDG